MGKLIKEATKYFNVTELFEVNWFILEANYGFIKRS